VNKHKQMLSILLLLPLLCASAARKPNVILIMTDDQGSADMPSYGSVDLQTPAMEKLASRGVRFTRFYSGAPVCSPSRAALLTGRYPLRAGLTGNAASNAGGHGMPTEQVTMAEMFKAAGYTTAHIGKWHLGYTEGEMPNQQGFDHSFGHMGGCIDNYSHFFYWNGPNRHDLYRNGEEVFYSGRFFGDLMVEEASEFMTKNRDKPFFIYFAINMPHYPYQGDPKWLAHYKELPYPRNLYAAFLSTCDERMGQLIEKVKVLGLDKETIIVYQSDNGHSTEERAHRGGGSAGIYRGEKFSLYEGGIRLPAVISWPGQLPEGAVRSAMVHSCDWMPTLAGLCGIKLLNEDIDGLDILPVIRSADAPTPHKELHWMQGGKKGNWSAMVGDWKLIGSVATKNGNTEYKPKELYNLNQDPSEQENLLNINPDQTQRLLKTHTDWFEATDKTTLPPTPVKDKKGNEV